MTLNAKQQTELSDEHELFCKLYALSEDRNIRDNATAAYALSHPKLPEDQQVRWEVSY